MEKNNQRKGMFIVLACGIMWGLSGVIGEHLFSISEISVGALSSTRLLVSGVALLIFLAARRDPRLFAIWKCKKAWPAFFAFTIFAVVLVQYTYFAAIKCSTAATGTVLQYTYLTMMLVYTAVKNKKLPKAYETVSILAAFAGIFCIATHGNIHSLAINPMALFWGLFSGVCFVFFTVFPGKLYEQFGLFPVVAWAFLIGGVLLAIVNGGAIPADQLSPTNVSLALAISVLGTLIPFTIYGKGVQILGSLRASLFVSIEPISSAVMSVIFLGSSFAAMDVVGFVLIIGAIEFTSVMGLRNPDLQKE